MVDHYYYTIDFCKPRDGVESKKILDELVAKFLGQIMTEHDAFDINFRSYFREDKKE